MYRLAVGNYVDILTAAWLTVPVAMANMLAGNLGQYVELMEKV